MKSPSQCSIVSSIACRGEGKMRFLHKFIKLSPLVRGAICLLFFCSLTILSAQLALSSSEETQPTSTNLTTINSTEIAQVPNLGKAFQQIAVTGSIVIYDKNNNRFYEHNLSRNTTAFFPASTFKILNALVSLQG